MFPAENENLQLLFNICFLRSKMSATMDCLRMPSNSLPFSSYLMHCISTCQAILLTSITHWTDMVNLLCILNYKTRFEDSLLEKIQCMNRNFWLYHICYCIGYISSNMYSNSSPTAVLLTRDFKLTAFFHLYFANHDIWSYIPVGFCVLAILAFKTSFLASRLPLLFTFLWYFLIFSA
jgi:hypothetical protein